MAAANPPRLWRGLTVEQRFWAKVDKTEACWLWTGAKNGKGYGFFTIDGIQMRAHRAAYAMFVGAIPDGLVLDHLCRVHHCVNPAHLEPVTSQENTRRGEPANRTLCPSGHSYEGENLKVNSKGRRECRTCIRMQRSAYKKRRRAEWKAAGTPRPW